MRTEGLAWPEDELLQATAAAAAAPSAASSIPSTLEPAVATPHQLWAGAVDGPLVLRSPIGLLAVRHIGRRRARLVAPDGKSRRVATAELAALVPAEAEDSDAVGDVVDGLRPAERRAVRAALRLDGPVDIGWRVRPAATAPLRAAARAERLGRWLALTLAAHAVVYALFLSVWVLVGGAAAGGTLDAGTVRAAVTVLLLLALVRAGAVWSAGVATVKAGSLVKRRITGGVLDLDPDHVRTRGIGELLGVVLEAEALETLALTGGYAALLAVAELAAAAVALAAGVRAPLLLGLLAGWIALAAIVGGTYFRRRRAWSTERLSVTHRLVEHIVGHRTRLVQEGRARLDPAADADAVALGRYERRAEAMDRAAALLLAALPRGWVVAGLVAVLAGGTVTGGETGPALASLGGVLLAFHGVEKLAVGLTQLADAAGAWARIRPLVGAGRAPSRTDTPSDADVLVALRDASFAHGDHRVLDRVAVEVRRGDRIVLEGPSGAGKSTLAMVMAGLRPPSTGAVEGTGAVGLAPQFHDNHVLSASFAFNLLLGRRWPPTLEDLRAASDLCHALGLGPLLAAMPAGLEQPVGETGWQLSHGERSRLFVARVLLAERPVVVLDESFAALDPEALRRTLACVVDRSPALVVIAHA